MLQRREEGEGVLRGQETGVGAILTRVVGEDLTDTTTSEQRSEKRGRVNHMDIWEGKLFGGVSTPPPWVPWPLTRASLPLLVK